MNAPVSVGTLVVGTLLLVPLVARAATERERERAAGGWAGPTSQLVWIDAQWGVESLQLRTFSADFDRVSVGFLPTSGVGPTAGVGAGVRLVFVTLGLRGRVAAFNDDSPTRTVGAWQTWTLDGELGLRIPLDRLEPHLALSGGYATFGGFDSAVRGLSAGLDVHGVDARLSGGVDYWVTRAFSLGVDASGGVLLVARPGVSVRDLAAPKQIGTLDEAKARVLEASGSSVGTLFAVTVGAGLHF